MAVEDLLLDEVVDGDAGGEEGVLADDRVLADAEARGDPAARAERDAVLDDSSRCSPTSKS